MKSICVLAFLLSASLSARDITVAAAANLSDVFQTVGQRFEKATGIHPVFSFGSTAQLTRQIENGGPFDVFAAADTEHIDQLEKEHLLAPGSKAVYAIGILALWIPAGASARVLRIEDLTQPSVKVIALAKPELAPYGLAARETLQHAGIWTQVEPKVVYAENISAAKQYGTSHNADAVFTAYSLVLKEQGSVIQVDEKLHAPIRQSIGIVAAAKDADGARQFENFLLKGPGREILKQAGYRIP